MAGDIHSMEILCNSRERENERERGRERNDCGEQFTMPAHAVTIIMTEQEIFDKYQAKISTEDVLDWQPISNCQLKVSM